MNNATPHGVALFFDAINKKNPNMTIRILKRAANGARTRDPQLGKLMLYQLSYFRKSIANVETFCLYSKIFSSQ